MSLFEKNDRIHHTLFPTQAREVFDVTGAGDTAIGVFALCMASGATFREAAFLANHAAGIVVGKVGTSTVSQSELRRAL
jgi:D-beta-D-heptose 7-phosphate kinase/D-beta-D-heptose 1-phosphate adenosyltransferase